MSIRLEIYGESGGDLQVALYYPVPQSMYNPLSSDQTRVPAGNAINPQELQDLKDGKLFELLTTLSVDGKSVQQLRGELEQLWQDNKNTARKQYKQSFSYIGRKWDGSWS